MPFPMNKTPVSMLQEVFSRRGSVPKYEELGQSDGLFRCKVIINDDVTAIGTGRSKKEAKHAAAKFLLQKFHCIPCSSTEELVPHTENVEDSMSPLRELKGFSNPVGQLQELCMSQHTPSPKYEVHGEAGKPHRKEFTIACIHGDLRITGTGSTKQQAKHQAAEKMLQSLNKVTVRPESSKWEMDEFSQKFAVRVPEDFMTDSLSPRKISSEVKDNQLQTTPLNEVVNCTQLLQELADANLFQVKYIEVDQQNSYGEYQCLVHTSAFPMDMCHGKGQTKEDAQIDAARNALEQLDLTVKLTRCSEYES